MKRYDALRKNKNFYMGIIFTVLEGLLSGCNSMVLYTIMLMLYNKSLELPIVLTVTAILGGFTFYVYLYIVSDIHRDKLEELLLVSKFDCS